jgi:hypothetical protein
MKRAALVAAIFVVAGFVGASSAFAASARLNTSDIAQIKRLCRSLVSLPAADMHAVLEQFRPYLRTKDELERHYWNCSSQHCTGTLNLRDDFALIYDFPAIPDPKAPLSLVPDAVEKGNNRISFAGLVRHGKVIFTIPSGVKPNLWRFHLTENSIQR